MSMRKGPCIIPLSVVVIFSSLISYSLARFLTQHRPVDAPTDSPSYTQDADMLFPAGSDPYVAPGSSPTVKLRRLVRGAPLPVSDEDDSNERRVELTPTQVETVGQAAMTTDDNVQDAFARLRQGQAESERRAKVAPAGKKRESAYVDDAAEESEEDERYNTMGMGRKEGDEEEDDGDDLGSVEGLVDDEQVPEEDKATQDARALEHHRSVIFSLPLERKRGSEIVAAVVQGTRRKTRRSVGETS
jgi:hypothetical protein